MTIALEPASPTERGIVERTSTRCGAMPRAEVSMQHRQRGRHERLDVAAALVGDPLGELLDRVGRRGRCPTISKWSPARTRTVAATAGTTVDTTAPP